MHGSVSNQSNLRGHFDVGAMYKGKVYAVAAVLHGPGSSKSQHVKAELMIVWAKLRRKLNSHTISM